MEEKLSKFPNYDQHWSSDRVVSFKTTSRKREVEVEMCRVVFLALLPGWFFSSSWAEQNFLKAEKLEAKDPFPI